MLKINTEIEWQYHGGKKITLSNLQENTRNWNKRKCEAKIKRFEDMDLNKDNMLIYGCNIFSVEISYESWK